MGEYSEAYKALQAALEALRAQKPNDRSEADRYYAVAITDLEKLIAVFRVYIEHA
jgi:adenylate cyclase class IV